MTMKNVADQLREDADDIWQHIIKHPFVEELYNGSLPKEKFEFYILNDYYYLTASIKNFSVISSKAPTVEEMREVVDILQLEKESEYEGYKNFLSRFGYSLQDAAEKKPIPVSVSYSSFLLSTSTLESYPEVITAVLPCFWSYAEIADYHSDKLHSNKNQLYVDWAKTYDTDSYQNLVEKMKQLVNRAGENFPYEKLRNVFKLSSRYEYMFWDSVYNKQRWPI